MAATQRMPRLLPQVASSSSTDFPMESAAAAGYAAFIRPGSGSLSAGLGTYSTAPPRFVGNISLEGCAGLSENVGALPDEDSQAALSYDGRLADLRCKQELLRTQVLAQPEDARLLWKLARVHSELHELSDFLAFAGELCRRHRPAWRMVSRVLCKLKRPDDAARFLLDMHQDEPGDAEVCCALAKLVEPALARRWYEKALQADPLCTEAALAIADACRKVDGNFAEAARLYEVAFQQRPTVKLLYRLGECLVQDGRGAEGRSYLMQVLSHEDDRTFDIYAVVMIALSYTMAQQHDQALEYCRRAEEIHAAAPSMAATSSRPLLKHASICKGIAQLNAGHPELAVETLLPAAQEAAAAGSSSPRWADEMLESTLGLAETFRGDMFAAKRHLEQAQRLGARASPSPDVLVNMAYLRQVQGDLEAAQKLLSHCLGNSKNNPMALLRMGYVLLCQDQLDRAAQFLQKCLEQPTGTLTYGVAQKGAAHFYLCVALHLRASERSALPPATASLLRLQNGHGARVEEEAAEEQFRNGHELLPHFLHTLTDVLHAPTSARTTHSSTSFARIGMVDLTFKQAEVLLWVAVRCGLVPATAFQQVAAPLPGGSDTPLAMAPLTSLPRQGVTASPKSAVSTAGEDRFAVTSISPQMPSSTLMGTTSTAAPASSGPSRDTSDRDLLHGSRGSGDQRPCTAEVTASSFDTSEALAAVELTAMLPSEKVLRFSEIEMGGCISHGEFTVVYHAVLQGSKLDVVVKSLHQKDCLRDEQAIAELRAEVAVIAELSHPRIVTFVGACLETSHLALVTELAPGGNLHQALHVRHRHLARNERFQLATELLEGVRYLHARSPPVVHLDLKSMNLVLDAEGQHLQICDFGLARILAEPAWQSGDEADNSDRSPSRGGSPRYMSPECYDSNLGALTEKADVWSSGCILIEIFGETLPYAECSNVQQILKLMLVHHCSPSIPESIEASVRSVIASMLAFEAQERLAIAQVLLQLQTIANSNAGESKSRFMWIP